MSAPGEEQAGSPFSARTVLWVILAGALAFLGLLVLSAYAPELRSGKNGGSHALSVSAVGFKAIVTLIDETGGTARLIRDEKALGTEDLLVLTPDLSTDPAKLAERVNRRIAQPTLIVLPKWGVMPLKGNKSWVQEAGPLPPPMIETLLAKVARLRVKRSAGGQLQPREGLTEAAQMGAPATYQSISGDKLTPLLVDREGRAALAAYDDRKLYILADPDLLDNLGMASEDRARAALAMLDDLNSTDAEGIAFDLTLNGFARSPSLLKLAFEPPFLALTLAILGAALLAGIHAWGRFGAPAGEERAIGFGKRALVDNAAGLIKRARREHRTGERYALMTRDVVASATGAPQGAGDAVLAAYLDRLGDPAGGGYSELAARATAAGHRDELLAAARALYFWRKDVTREG